MAVANTLAYYNTPIITGSKSFIVQVPDYTADRNYEIVSKLLFFQQKSFQLYKMLFSKVLLQT
jgi:hypothetical protein